MTLEEAEANIGRNVIYRPPHGEREIGVVTSVGERFVFVRYGTDSHSKATDPAHLTLPWRRHGH